MGPVRSYNQCRHRWHNVIKHRGNIPESEHRQNEDLAHEQWVAAQQASEHQHHMMHPDMQQMNSASGYGNIDKFDV